MKSYLAIAAAASFLLLTGCGDYAGKEKTHPLFVKAGSCKVSGDHKEAARLFEEFLLVCPKSAAAHYELAALYGDSLHDSLSAIYHYKKYLVLSGGKTADAEDVGKMIKSAEKKLFNELSQQYESPETQKALEAVKKANENTQKWIAYSKRLRELYNELRAQNDDMRKQITSGKVVRIKQRPAAKTESGPAAVTQKTESKAATAEPTDKKAPQQSAEIKYRVKNGDTLSRISRTVYGNSRYYSLILNANKDRIPKNGRLRVGQELIIPQIPAVSGKK